MGDSDPYKTTRVSASGTTKVALNVTYTVQAEIRCTRCWRYGHTWKECTANTCSACGKLFNEAKFCSGWENHQDKGTRWAPTHLIDDEKKGLGIKKKRSREEEEKEDDKGSGDNSDAFQTFKQAKKIYMAARKDLQKKKK